METIDASTLQSNLDRLKEALQTACKAKEFERMVAALVGCLLQVPISVASSGFQYGSDAGSTGHEKRNLRIECKRYSNATRLRTRELQGEIYQAHKNDKALEAWILACTREVPLQILDQLTEHGDELGITVVVIGWEADTIPALAALCAVEPSLVEKYVSANAASLAQAVRPYLSSRIEQLKQRLQSYYLGFEMLRSNALDNLSSIWNEPITAYARLGQNVAGGNRSKRIRRLSIFTALNEWWEEPKEVDSPIIIHGLNGVGKTWSAIEWLVEKKEEHPIIIIAASSSFVGISNTSSAIRDVIANLLFEISGIRDLSYWLRKLDRLLERPIEEGPVITLCIDGLNQQPSVDWLKVFKTLQAKPFSGHLRVLSTTRQHYYENRLSKLKGLVKLPHSIMVTGFDNSTGGELEQMLELNGFKRSDFHCDTLELASNPRMFDLVIRYGQNLDDPSKITLHQLLWEYGKDSIGIEAGNSFSEREWRNFLREIGRICSEEGNKELSESEIEDLVSLRSLSLEQVYARLSDFIDEGFAEQQETGAYKLSPLIIPHALAVSLIYYLRSDEFSDEEMKEGLNKWFDPITGYDQKAEILRAAVSVATSLDDTHSDTHKHIMREMVVLWLQSQNIPESHSTEIRMLAPDIVDPLLYTIEKSREYSYSFSLITAVNAIRSISSGNLEAMNIVVDRVCDWYSVISIDAIPRRMKDPGYARKIEEHFNDRIGTCEVGHNNILGFDIETVNYDSGSLLNTATSIMKKYPLVPFIRVFELAALSIAIRGYNEGWSGLKWLTLFNDQDPEEIDELIHGCAENILKLTPEAGIHSQLPAYVSATLLRFSNNPGNEIWAKEIDPCINKAFTYEEYLSEPGKFFYQVERRHANEVLLNQEYSVLHRIAATTEHWLDPTFEPPEQFKNELCDYCNEFDISMLFRSRGFTKLEHDFEYLEVALARCAADVLARMIQRRLKSPNFDEGRSRYMSAIFARSHLLLTDEDVQTGVRSLRFEGDEASEASESYSANQLIIMEIVDMPPVEQFISIIEAELNPILSIVKSVLKSPSIEDTDSLVDRYKSNTLSKQYDLLVLLFISRIDLSDDSWQWVEKFLSHEDTVIKRLAYRVLYKSDPEKLGRMLLADDWKWNLEDDEWINHFCSSAIVEVSRDIHFEQVISRIAPWKLLDAVVARGSNNAELRLAVDIIDRIIRVEDPIEFDPGAEIHVSCTKLQSEPCFTSVEPEVDDDSTPLTRLQNSSRVEEKILAHEKAQEVALERIKQARSSGADLLYVNIRYENFLTVIKQFPEMVSAWLEGYSVPTVEFVRRVRLAEKTFISLCEALLHEEPELGVQLWSTLNSIGITKFIGAADIDEMMHIVFRVPDSPEVNKLREDMLSLESCNTDLSLFEIAATIRYNDKIDWLKEFINRDMESGTKWRIMRGTILVGFIEEVTLPWESAWPERELITEMESIKVFAEKMKWREACAKHWWDRYLSSEKQDEAYADWVLFNKSADRRALIWMSERTEETGSSEYLNNLKQTNVKLNESYLLEEMDKKNKKLEGNFLRRSIFKGIEPWI